MRGIVHGKNVRKARASIGQVAAGWLPMNVVGYSSPFVPAEWIAAHGLQPCRLQLRATERLVRGVCPYAGALIEAFLPSEKGTGTFCRNGPPGASHKRCLSPFPSALILTTVCDQMRYAAAILEQRGGCPVFLMNVPSTWQTPAARQLYLDELRRLGRFLVGLGGRAPTDAELSREMLAQERARNENSRRPTAGGEASRWGDSCTVAPGDGSATAIPTAPGIPLAILGGPLMENDEALFELVERAGGRVVLDATEDGQRTLPRPFDRERLAADPLQELADAYFDAIPDAFRRPNTKLYEWLEQEVAARQVRGIILRRYLWCDLWHAALAQLRQSSRVPVLEIDVGPDDVASPNRVQGRIEAFLETLR
jgi:benzoyl-CoA reductase/2-hydroxyglutaryl-CoA dehydratase subunit BcrC/BadD/HgdB